MLWPEEMPDCTLLVLSAFDDLVPAHLCERQLKQMNSPCQVSPDQVCPGATRRNRLQPS